MLSPALIPLVKPFELATLKRITMSQDKNIAIAQQLLAGIGEGRPPEILAAMFAEDLRFEIQGDDGVLPWIGHKAGRQAAANFSTSAC
jgi:hypothetical protein